MTKSGHVINEIFFAVKTGRHGMRVRVENYDKKDGAFIKAIARLIELWFNNKSMKKKPFVGPM